LALRGETKEDNPPAKFMSANLGAVGLQSGDDLVDIGCGDGTLLRMAERIGTKKCNGPAGQLKKEVGAADEVCLNVKQVSLTSYRLTARAPPWWCGNSVVAGGFQRKNSRQLAQNHRIAKPGASIFVGEIPLSRPRSGAKV